MSNFLYEWIMDIYGNVVVGERILSQNEITAIFGSGNWSWPGTTSSGNTTNNVPAIPVPTETQTLYRRSTHD